MLYYTMNLSTPVVRAMPTSAPPGPAADRSRTVMRAAVFVPTDWVGFTAISPGGSTLYFVTYPEGRSGPGPGQVRALNLATGRSRVVYAPVASVVVTADPAVQNFLWQIPQRGMGSHKLLARLNLATGRITDLPSGWLVPPGAVLTW
jgi:hypothetical protein